MWIENAISKGEGKAVSNIHLQSSIISEEETIFFAQTPHYFCLHWAACMASAKAELCHRHCEYSLLPQHRIFKKILLHFAWIVGITASLNSFNVADEVKITIRIHKCGPGLSTMHKAQAILQTLLSPHCCGPWSSKPSMFEALLLSTWLVASLIQPQAALPCQAACSWSATPKQSNQTYLLHTVTAQSQSQDESERSAGFHLHSPLSEVLPGRRNLPGLGWNRRVNKQEVFPKDCNLFDCRVF